MIISEHINTGNIMLLMTIINCNIMRIMKMIYKAELIDLLLVRPGLTLARFDFPADKTRKIKILKF